jgi:protein-disulfide isomerase/uncharacterized membrane protein
VAKGNKKAKRAQRGLAAKPTDPRRGWWIGFILLCVAGTALSAELERMHVRMYSDPDYQSYCAISEALDCDAVAASPYSVVFGLPLAVWGIIAYLTMGALAAWGLLRRPSTGPWPHALAFALSVIAALAGIGLLWISHFMIGAVCLLCGATYLVSFGLVACAIGGLSGNGRRPLAESWRLLRGHALPVVAFCVAVAALTAAARAQVPAYWRTVVTQGPGGLPAGIDADGRPWIGAVDPEVTIVEYSDYECPHCERGHAQVRRIVAENATVRLVHRHYPLDQQCNTTMDRPLHHNACAYARFAWCAQQQGKFWEANDHLFANRGREITIRSLAAAIGADAARLEACAASDAAEHEVAGDLAAGRAAGVRGTPTFVIDGRLYAGSVPPDALGPVRRDQAPAAP